jgi:MFS transporter, putative metabolite:H+ symporter
MTDNDGKTAWRAVIVAAVGYFVDLFDTFLLPALRVTSLRDLGVLEDQSLATYTVVFNWQLAGMALGALLLWGPFADRRGRRTILFGSIIVYSLANLLTAAVQDVNQYAIARFIAGVGLGGELGAGITLISEHMKNRRGIGTMVVGGVGMLGVVAASLLALTPLHWRASYVVGGLLGIAVLGMRIGVKESDIFQKSVGRELKPAKEYLRIMGFMFSPRRKAGLGTAQSTGILARFQAQFTERPLVRYLLCVFVGFPTFFITGLLVPGAPEFGKSFGMAELPVPATGLIFTYLAIAAGDILCGYLSQIMSSRKKALLIFHGVTVLGICSFLFFPPVTPNGFYLRCVISGLGIGYWANMVTNVAEQFGTDVRATATITVPNFVRFLLFPISSAFLYLKPVNGVINAAAIVGLTSSAIAIGAVLLLKDNFSRDLDYTELV